MKDLRHFPKIYPRSGDGQGISHLQSKLEFFFHLTASVAEGDNKPFDYDLKAD